MQHDARFVQRVSQQCRGDSKGPFFVWQHAALEPFIRTCAKEPLVSSDDGTPALKDPVSPEHGQEGQRRGGLGLSERVRAELISQLLDGLLRTGLLAPRDILHRKGQSATWSVPSEKVEGFIAEAL